MGVTLAITLVLAVTLAPTLGLRWRKGRRLSNGDLR